MKKLKFSVCFAIAVFATTLVSLETSLAHTTCEYSSIFSRIPRGLGNEDDGKQPTPTPAKESVNDILKSLGNEYEPLVSVPSTSTGSRRSSLDREAECHASGAAAEQTFSREKTRFMAKHLFQGGQGNPAEFEKLLKDPEYLKKYIIETDLEAPSAKVLYRNANERKISSNLNNMKARKLTVISAKIETLQADIQAKYDKWKSSGDTGDPPVFETTEKYPIAGVSYEPEVIKKTPMDSKLHINLEHGEARLKIGVDSEGKINHFEGLADPKGDALKTEKRFAHFDAPELEYAVGEADVFRNFLGVTKDKSEHGWALNDKAPLYETLKPYFDESLEDFKKNNQKPELPKGVCKSSGSRRKRARGCSVILGEDGQVEKIIVEDFVQTYKEAGEVDKQRLTELAKNNMDKISEEGLDATHSAQNKKEMSKLIQLENTKTHKTSMDAVASVHELKTDSFHNSLSESVEALHNKVSTIKSKVKLSSSKLGQKMAHLANRAAASHIGQGMASMSESFGRFFLAKTVITGIIHGDTTSLAIVGGRVGYDVVTEAGVYAGTKFFSGASKVGKFTKVLGKVAGPIGAAVDLGMGIWSLTKSVGRLHNATNKYDRDDAIADIVSDSVDIAVTAGVTIISIAFPPAAPIAMAVGLIITVANQMANALFKSGNEVARINSEVPLLDSEKEYVFTSRLFDLFGTRGKDYLDYLVEEKQANDMAVKQNLEILQKNPSIYGIVFPSRTMEYDGGCELVKQYCTYHWGELCWKWEEKRVLGSDCDWNKPCGWEGDICSQHRESLNSGYNQYDCDCSKGSKTTFGFPRSDSHVDFRKTQTVYWERSVPSDVEGADFKCKPGSTTFDSYLVHQEYSRDDFYCENAISILQPSDKREKATTMLFDLEDGEDTVYAGNDAQSNLFRVGNGTKNFFGSDGCRNEFLLDDNYESLSGSLEGGNGEVDALIVLQNCSRGQWLEFDFKEGKMRNQKGNINIEITKINEIDGREKEGDRVTATCDLRKVILGGGTLENPDKIVVPSGDECKYNLTAVLGDFTALESKASRGLITLLVGSSFKSVSVELELHPKESLSIPFVFSSTHSSQVLINSVSKDNTSRSITIKKKDEKDSDSMNLIVTAPSSKEFEQMIYFTETHFDTTFPDSILMISSATNTPIFYHSLPELKDVDVSHLQRQGCSNIPNLFDITGANWTVVGGNEDDEFILHSPLVTEIDGGGGDDTLQLHKDIKSDMMIDLSSRSKQFGSIEIVKGSPGQAVTVGTECSTKLVALMGGSPSKPDLITIPGDQCYHRELKVLAVGNTKVNIASKMGIMERDSITVVIPASTSTSAPVLFEMDVSNESKVMPGLILAIQLSHVNWKGELEWEEKESKFQVRLYNINNKDEKIILKLPKSKEMTPILPYIDISKVSDEPSGQLWVAQNPADDLPQLQIIYELRADENNMKNQKGVSGLVGISNAFRFTNGSWKVEGGKESDIFAIFPAAQLEKQNLNGGDGGDNLLVLESNAPSQTEKVDTFLINLETGEFGFLKSSEKGNITNVEHVIGRSDLPDIFHVGCNTKTVNGRGGGAKAGSEDLIFISRKDCEKGSQVESEIHVEMFTKVINTATHGEFRYLVSNFVNSEIKLNTSVTNNHLIKFGFHPWEQIAKISFDEAEGKLGFWSGEKTDIFPLSRNDSTSDYNNPTFQFHKPESNITADVEVTKDGIVVLTYGIHGNGLATGETVQGLQLDVNRFLINVTETRTNSEFEGIIIGSSTTKLNQFWIFELQSTLAKLDGGACSNNDCRNYLHIAESFEEGKDIEIHLKKGDGRLRSGGDTVIRQLLNIHELRGRNGKDKVAVSSCDVRQISGVDEIIIQNDKGNDCSFDLTMEIGENTTVWFEDPGSRHSSMEWVNSTFHYRFTSPRSFDLNGSSLLAWLGPIHNYYLPFTVDDLQSIRFDLEEQKLNYSIAGKEYQHSMILGASYKDPFYSQPSIITNDNFKIQIGRDGSILFTMGSGSSFPTEEGTMSIGKIMNTFHSAAKRLGVSFVLQTKTQFFYVGHGKLEGHGGNVLQNVNYSVSYLGGGGADDTIYDITSLSKDIFVYPGFDLSSNQTDDNNTIETKSKQTLDLSDIVVPIRRATDRKYVPTVIKQDKDLVIVMSGFENKYPGKVYIVGGAEEEHQLASRIQLLLGHSMMNLVEDPVTKEWRIRPTPILVPEGTIYTIAKEDVEDNHEIFIVEHEASLVNATFKCVQNGLDLYVTNIIYEVETDKADEHPGHFEITTIIITDFYEDDKVNTTLPDNVSGVTLKLPGLHIMLEGNDIVHVQEQKPKPQSFFSSITKQSFVEKVSVLEWNFVLHEVEEYILKGLDDIPREFQCDKCTNI